MDIKSILLGIGIGIILTAMIGMVYSKGSEEMSKDEIIQKARDYGLVEKNIFVEEIDSLILSDEKKSNENVNKLKKSNDIIELVIERGDTSEIVANKLMKLGIISNKLGFEENLSKKDLAKRIKVGVYEINKDAKISEIIELITAP